MLLTWGYHWYLQCVLFFLNILVEELIKRESLRPCLSSVPGTLWTQQTWSEGSWRTCRTCWCHLRRSTRPAQTTPRPPLYRCQTPEPSSPWYSEIILSERKKNLHKILLVATGWWWRRWSFEFNFECLMLWQYVVGLSNCGVFHE